MSYNNYKVRQPSNRVVGSISGFDTITTNTVDGITPVSDHLYTIPDLVSLLKGVKSLFDPKKMAEIEKRITTHINNLNNPHATTLESMGTSVIQELYKEWLNAGNTGTRDEFLKVLFQYVRIADIPTTRKGESYTEVTSCKGVTTLLQDHDTSLTAHDPLISKLFPGSMLSSTPTYSLKAYLGIDNRCNISRASKMYVYDSCGNIKEVDEDVMEADYGLGEAAFPIFDETINLVADSEHFNDTSYYLPINCFVNESKKIHHLRNEGEYSLRIRESNIFNINYPSGFGFDGWNKAFPFDQKPFSSLEPSAPKYKYTEGLGFIGWNKAFPFDQKPFSRTVTPEDEDYVGDGYIPTGPSFHGIKYSPSDIEVVKNEYYTISLFVRDDGRYACGIDISEEDIVGRYPFAQYDLQNSRVFINANQTNITGYIYPLLGGWSRLQYTFKALKDGIIHPRVYSLDIFDGDSLHDGVEGAGVSIFGLMVTKTASIPPYIASLDGVKGKLAKTTFTINVDRSWYKSVTGTLMVECTNARNVTYTDNKYIYTVASMSTNAIQGRFPPGNRNRAYISTWDSSGYVLSGAYTGQTNEYFTNVILSWDHTGQYLSGATGGITSVSTTGTPSYDSTLLHVGSDRQGNGVLNGYVKNITYYPAKMTTDNIHFLRMSED